MQCAESVCRCRSESAMDDDANKPAGDNVRLSVSIDEQDYDIRSEAGASIDGDDKEKETKLGGNPGEGDGAAGTVAEGTLCRLLCFGRLAWLLYCALLKQLSVQTEHVHCSSSRMRVINHNWGQDSTMVDIVWVSPQRHVHCDAVTAAGFASAAHHQN